MKNEKWTITIANGEMRVPYISEENTSFIDRLTERWTTMAQGLWEDEFNFDEFKCLLKDTAPVLLKYVSVVVPNEIVSLVLAIKEFEYCPEINIESRAAIQIAQYLSDAANFCNVNVNRDADERIYISVFGNNKAFDIYIDDLDFGELISDLDS